MFLCPATRLQVHKQNKVRNVVAHIDNYFSRLVHVNVLAVLTIIKPVCSELSTAKQNSPLMWAHGFFLKQKKQTIIFNARARSMHEKWELLQATAIPAVKSKNKQKFEAHVRTWASKRAEHAKTTIKPVNSYFRCK